MKASFRTPHGSRANESGFTLVELMVALSGGLFLSVVVFALARDASRFYQRETRLATATLAGITGFERLKGDIARASYLCTPNFADDNQVRPSSDGVISNLAGVRIIPGGSDVDGTPAFSVNRTAGQALDPDSIELAGSFAATDEFPGSIDPSGSTITLAGNSPSLARLGYIGADADTQRSLLERVFAAERIVRFVEMGSRFQSYGRISSVTVGTNPQIALESPMLGIDGLAVGSSVSVVNRVRYRIGDLRTNAGAAWKPLFDASEAPGEAGRTELLREEFIDEDTVVAGSLDIAAEYAVDLEFGVTGQATAGGPLTYVPSSNGTAFAQFFDEGSGRPQGVRSVRVRLSVRSREADRETNVSGAAGQLYRFKLGDGLGWARVRTFQADVALPNQATVTW